jgi:CheY-like chemotaxis protein
MNPPLLFIDDQYSPNKATIEALQLHFEVEHIMKARPALERLLTRSDWAAIVVDMMMPAPRDWWLETQEGQFTGLKILADAREHLIRYRIPVLVFTNRNLEPLARRLDGLGLPSALFERREKDKQSPEDTLKLILDMIASKEPDV